MYLFQKTQQNIITKSRISPYHPQAVPGSNKARASFKNSTTQRPELQLPLRNQPCITKWASANMASKG
jgi:hypothetical protein